MWRARSEPGVYMIRHTTSGKVYIGSSAGRSGILGRMNRHIEDLRGGGHHSVHLQRAWDKYGPEAFEFIVLEYCPAEECLDREQVFMDFYKCTDRRHGYNISPTAGNCLGVRHTAETRAKISAAGMGRRQSAESIEKTASKIRGLKRSEESRARISVAARKRWETEDRQAWSEKIRARVLSDEVRAILSANGKRHAGRKRSEETKAKMRAVWDDPDYRQRWSDVRRGKKMSPEAIAKSASKRKGMKRSEETRARLKALQNDPEYKARRQAAKRARKAEFLARLAAENRARLERLAK